MFALHTLHFCCVFCFAFVCILYFGVNFLVLFLEFGKEKEKLSPAACRANLTHHEKKEDRQRKRRHDGCRERGVKT